MMCHRIGLPPISTMGLGRKTVSSERRVPNPPAKITAFIGSLLLLTMPGGYCLHDSINVLGAHVRIERQRHQTLPQLLRHWQRGRRGAGAVIRKLMNRWVVHACLNPTLLQELCK